MQENALKSDTIAAKMCLAKYVIQCVICNAGGWVMQGYVQLQNLGMIHIALTNDSMLRAGLGAPLGR